jgi:Protein NO VEIN, C-terminal
MLRLLRPTLASITQTGSRPSSRRSGRAKAIGDIGERIVLKWLRDQVDAEYRDKIVHIAETGATPGWDIESRIKVQPDVYEVKATNGKRFPAIEITANEWAAAERLGSAYNLVLVAECESRAPVIQVINDPWGLLQQQRLVIEPVVYRLVRVG